MAKFKAPENIQIAALQQRKVALAFDPMAPGPGSPWEDRGTHGTVGAFLRTAIGSMTGPGKLLTSIRRPETTGDARVFLLICASLWGVSAVVHAIAWFYYEQRNPDWTLNLQNCIVLCIVYLAGTIGGIYLLFGVYCKIYGRLVAQEKGAPHFQESLIYNVAAYSMGPSLLVLIPFAGPVLALVGIYFVLVAGGVARLRLRFTAALIDATLSLVAVVAAALAVIGIGCLLMTRIISFYGVEPPQAPVNIPAGMPGGGSPGR